MSSGAHRLGIATRGPEAQVLLEPMLVPDGVVVIACSQPDLAAVEAPTCRGTNREEPISATFSDDLVLVPQHRLDVVAIFSSQHHPYQPAADVLQADCHLFL